MRVLIIYQLPDATDRNTILEHLYSFEKYSTGIDFHYLNVFHRIPTYMLCISYDAILLHYTYLAGERFLKDDGPWLKKINLLNRISGYKVAMPQDEYDHTDRNCELFKRINVQALYTCFMRKEDIESAYPFSKTGVDAKKIFSVFTGYVDENVLPVLKDKILPYSQRPIDIGYRARKLPAYFGRHGQLKYELVDFFAEVLKEYDFVYDISNTNTNVHSENRSLVKLGNEWYEFLLSCKAFIGCEGGSSLLDNTGEIKELVNQYSQKHPNATFDEIEKECFPGLDYNISCFAVSPRHFEAAMCKTLQILVEGDYGGAFEPWRHYIPLKRDFSNYREVLEVLKDEKRCQEIVDNAYNEVVLSDKFTYRRFVESVVNDMKKSAKTNRDGGAIYKLLGKLLQYRNNNYWKVEKQKRRFEKAYSWRYKKYIFPLLVFMNIKKARDMN